MVMCSFNSILQFLSDLSELAPSDFQAKNLSALFVTPMRVTCRAQPTPPPHLIIETSDKEKKL